jgi:DNA-binding transcriptional MocR family regulator
VQQVAFTRGVPSLDLLPVDELRACAQAALEREPGVALGYGPGAGHAGLREWIAGRHGVSADQVVCTNGSLQALEFVAEALLADRPRRRAMVEAPTYDRAILVLRRAGAEVTGVSLDGDGLDVDALEQAIERDGPPAFVYVIPNFQNPSGTTLSADRRTRLAEVARANDMWIVEDDPYGLLRFRGEPLTALRELAPERTIALSSFTKTVAPGLRVGYAVAPEGLAPVLAGRATTTYISPSMLSQSTLAAYCASGAFEPWVEQATAELARRCDAMLEALEAGFPAGVAPRRPDGGYFVWVDLPESVDTTDLLPRATAEGVPYVKGADFFADGGGHHAMRLAYSAVGTDAIADGIARLAATVDGALAAA